MADLDEVLALHDGVLDTSTALKYMTYAVEIEGARFRLGWSGATPATLPDKRGRRSVERAVHVDRVKVWASLGDRGLLRIRSLSHISDI
jgi:hypothetical protein